MSIAAEIRRMVEEDGLSYEKAISIAERFELALSGGKSGGSPVDTAAEKRRAYDRERKEKQRAEEKARAAENGVSGGSPVESPNDAYKEPTSLISTEKLEDLGGVGERAKSKRGKRLAPDWQPSPEDIAFAQAEGMSAEAIRRETEKYRDYWIAVSGAKGVKTDWPATWRNWIRRNLSPPPQQTRQPRHETPSDRMRAAFSEVDGLFAGRGNHEILDLGPIDRAAIGR